MITRNIHLKAIIEMKCCRDGVIAYSPRPQEFYKDMSKTKETFPENLDAWKNRIINHYDDERKETAENECKNISETLKLCFYNSDWSDTTVEETIEKIKDETIEKIKEEIRKYEEKRKQELIKIQQKQQKEEQKRKAKLEKEKAKAKEKPIEEIIIPVTIDEIPTTITIKKELTTIDVIQISRLAKSITKLEKQKEEQEKYLNITLAAIKRIEESEKLELMLGQVVTRDRWMDEINRTNVKIQKQKDVIKHIKSGI